ncbi:MAG TPA: sugar phosphate nucleotidyltransferase [Terrimicrobiaceae bacterium]
MPKQTLLVLAAGMGSRYGGLKQVDPMGPSGETLLDYSVFDAVQAGFDRVVFIIRRDIEEEFREKVGARYKGNVPVDYAFQQLDFLPNGFSVPADRKKPWGTAHAVWCAREAITEPFAAINADDFYGRETYEVIGRFLKAAQPEGANFAMAGYRLDHTLSEHGSVARGVCQVDSNRRLITISECTGIERADGEIVQKEADGSAQKFRGDEPVSMNFWGLTPAIFPLVEEQLVAFLSTSSSDPKAECYIPEAIGALIARDQATLDVLPTNADWFGVTYREDKPQVMQALKKLHSEAAYPTPLWK